MTRGKGSRGEATRAKGQRAEQLAASHLQKRGYRVLQLNYRIKQGEIDIIAEHGGVLCFVEVRSRRDSDHGHPLETVGGRKRARLIHAARHFLMVKRWENRQTRFDVVGIVYQPQLEIRLVQGAFEASSVW